MGPWQLTHTFCGSGRAGAGKRLTMRQVVLRDHHRAGQRVCVHGRAPFFDGALVAAAALAGRMVGAERAAHDLAERRNLGRHVERPQHVYRQKQQEKQAHRHVQDAEPLQGFSVAPLARLALEHLVARARQAHQLRNDRALFGHDAL